MESLTKMACNRLYEWATSASGRFPRQLWASRTYVKTGVPANDFVVGTPVFHMTHVTAYPLLGVSVAFGRRGRCLRGVQFR